MYRNASIMYSYHSPTHAVSAAAAEGSRVDMMHRELWEQQGNVSDGSTGIVTRYDHV